MNSPTLGLRVASAIFGLVGLAHILRIIGRVNVQVGDIYIRRSVSAVAVVVLAVLCVWLWRLASQSDKAKTETPPIKPSA